MTLLVSDAMTEQVRSVQPDTTLLDLERLLMQWRLGGAPVVRKGELVGIVSRTDIVRRLLAAQEFRDYAEAEQSKTTSPFDLPLQELWPTAQRTLDPGIEAQLRKLQVADVMLQHVATVPADMPLHDAGRLMVERRIHRVVVVESQKPVGVLSTFDIVRCLCGPIP
jgi:CBS domain-containing protein